MIKEDNICVKITLSRAQAKYLDKISKKAGITKSKYISWMLSKSGEELLKLLKVNTIIGELSPLEIEKIIRYDFEE